jgi:isoleucyl-tRNA synthetase
LHHDTLNLEKDSEVVLAEEIMNKVMREGDSPWKKVISSSTLIERVSGRDLIESTPGLRHPFIKSRVVPLVPGQFVGTDQGTGLVHIAPGHGEEDFEIGRIHRLRTDTPVNEKGRYSEKINETSSDWVGIRIQEAAPLVTGLLKQMGTLLYEEMIEHSYPHCWRCKNPVFYRATSQWFLSLSKYSLREETLDAIEKIEWIPEKGKNRIRGMIETRPDWCLSRQRAWGVPIPAFFCINCGKSTLTKDFILEIADRTEFEGVDFWFDEKERAGLLAGKKCPECGGNDLNLEEDILDVWFDSGVSHEAVLKKRPDLKWPADLYLEGSDQHRGWFHSSLLTSMALEGKPPYTTVLTHGFVVDGQGKKMAKTLGNVIAPSEIIDKYGADVLRLWVAAADYQEDTRLSMEILNNLVDSYRKIRNTFRYMLSNLYDYKSDEKKPGNRDLLDKWILSVWERTKQGIRESYQTRRFAQVIQSLNNFCSISLSAQYFDMIKDRMYAERASGPLRKGTQETLCILLDELTSLIQPILPFTTSEISVHTSKAGIRNSPNPVLDVMTSEFPRENPERIDLSLEKQIEKLLPVRTAFGRMTDDLKKEKIIGSTMEIHLRIKGDPAKLNLSEKPNSFFETFFIVSAFTWISANSTNNDKILARTIIEDQNLEIELLLAEGKKCERCWLWKKTTGNNKDQWPVCARCYQVLETH